MGRSRGPSKGWPADRSRALPLTGRQAAGTLRPTRGRSRTRSVADVLIIGAGICGLGTALLLARDGHDVLVIERDADPVPNSPQEAWDAWDRKGVAQFRQPHNFMPGLRLI